MNILTNVVHPLLSVNIFPRKKTCLVEFGNKLGVEYKQFNLDKFEELPNLYNCLDLYLISSRDEGGPTGLGEAMAWSPYNINQSWTCIRLYIK